DNPSVKLKLCNEIVVEETEVKCTCERSDPSLINASIVWYATNRSKDDRMDVIFHNSPSLYLKHYSKKTAYYCKALHTLKRKGMESTAVYSPKVIASVQTIACEKYQLKEVLTAVCQTNQIFPGAECQFLIKYNHIYHIYTEYNITRYTMHTSDDPVYYQT
ncbi:unnamed protein product, partial [Lymnaea stagnalis]